MMKKIFAIITAFVLCCVLEAEAGVREMWVQMPDSMVPYLNKNLRQECIDFVDMGISADVQNTFGANTILDTLTADYLHVTLNQSSTLEMKMLPRQGGDSLLCLVRTYMGPERESTIEFYNAAWQRLDMPSPILTGDGKAMVEMLTQRPDTMTAERFSEIRRMFEPVMVSATLSPADTAITLQLSAPLTTSDEKKAIKAVSVQRKLKWDGKTFK